MRLFKFRRESETGFSLVEVLIVVVVIAVLIAIAVPTFMGSRDKADDRSAQASLRLAMSAARVRYTDAQDYTVAGWNAMPALEPSLTYVRQNVESTKPTEISVKAASSETWYAAAKSRSGSCYYIKDAAAGQGTSYASYASGGGECSGNAAHLVVDTDWQRSW